MRLATISAMIGIVGSTLCFAQRGGTATPMKTLMDSASYALGLNIGASLKKDSVFLDAELIKAGVIDAMAGTSTRFSDSTAQSVLMALQQSVMERAQARLAKERETQGAINRQKGAEFLAANKNKPGVRVTPSGLQYIVEVEGSGPSPGLNDVVQVNYRGTLVNGVEFDKSEPGRPVEFPVSGVIAGWVEALQMMKPGARWKLFIPSDLAYGEYGTQGGQIGPNETLIFEVELLSIVQQ